MASHETIAFRAINAFFLGGLILDIMSASLAFLTSRWLQRLTDDEKKLFEDKLTSVKKTRQKKSRASQAKQPTDDSLNCTGVPHAEQQIEGDLNRDVEQHSHRDSQLLRSAFYSWLSLSLFVPMPLLVLGVLSMVCGLYVYAWTQHPWIVATMFSIAGGATAPFLFGVFLIGQDPGRRKNIIHRLSRMQGDW